MPNSATNRPTADVKIKDFLIFASERLTNSAIENPNLDARLLVAHGLHVDRAQLLTLADRMLTRNELNRLTIFIECRARHESVARICGQREFWGLPFELNRATLEPRPDSETLIEATLKRIPQKERPLRILDLGTGTGCLLLSLLHELPMASGVGVDFAPPAIEQATKNAEKLALSSRTIFQVGSWFHGLVETFDIIVSNPPYIRESEIATLMPEVRDHDPHLALNGGVDGLKCYRELIPELKAHLKPDGLVVLEVGQHQADAVKDLLKLAGFARVAREKDLSGVERALVAEV